MSFDEGPINGEEVRKVMRKLKVNKAPGLDGIHPEMLKHGGDIMVREICNMCNIIWKKECVPEDWTDCETAEEG